MIIVMKPGAPMQECEKIKNGLINNGFQINEIVGVNMTILGVIGDTSTLDINLLRVNDWVEKVMRVQEPFKRANRMFHPEDSVVDVNGIKIGGKKIIKSVGMDMVKLEKYQGFSADIAASLSLLFSSVFGIPVSTTHAKTTAIMGVGAVKRLSAINFGVVKDMGLTWILTFPGCGFIGFLMTKLFMWLF